MIDHAPWPRRAAILLLVGALAGLCISMLIDGPGNAWTQDHLRLAAALFVGTGAILLAFTLERPRWIWSVAFALAGALVVACTFYWNGAPNDSNGSEGWRMVSAFLAVIIAAPLFQTLRDEGRVHLPEAAVHAQAWTNVVLWFAGWAFVLLAFLLTLLLSELFALVGIRLLKEALNQAWFVWMLAGGAGGGVLGILRDRDRVLGHFQRVAMAILAVLAPVLAAGLVLFVLALPFTGLAPLWEQTKSTTPILLSCIAGAIILANAVVDQAADEQARHPLLRYSAMALAAVMFPLAVVAMVSTAKRISQYGFTPSRLWAATFVIVAIVCAAGYLFTLLRGRRDWVALVRPTNVKLAIVICGLAFLLATPIINFGAISTRDQLARLDAGKVSPDKFDWAALRYDFGPSGRAAVERLAHAGRTAAIRTLAKDALTSEDRYAVQADQYAREQGAKSPKVIQVLPAGTAIPDALRAKILADPPVRDNLCFGPGACRLFWRPGDKVAVVVQDSCAANNKEKRQIDVCGITTFVLEQRRNAWEIISNGTAPPLPSGPEVRVRQQKGLKDGVVEVRTIQKRQLFIGKEAVGAPFD